MRNYELESTKRVEYIRKMVSQAGASGIVFGNSGGKDSALVGILCKMACDNTVGLILPCESNQNYGQDSDDANLLKDKFGIRTNTIDLTNMKKDLVNELSNITPLNHSAQINIPPRLRMTALYAYGACNNMLVAGTGNKCERYVGYFTKWGDGAFDFNPISDLTVSEIYEFLRYLEAPESIINKAPSAGLYEGQTDELDMGVTYEEIEAYLNNEAINEKSREIIERMHRVSAHKLQSMSTFRED